MSWSPQTRAWVERQAREDPEYRRLLSERVTRELEVSGRPRFFVEQPSRRRIGDYFPTCGCPVDEEHTEWKTDNRWPGKGSPRCKIHRRATQNAANAAKRRAQESDTR